MRKKKIIYVVFYTLYILSFLLTIIFGYRTIRYNNLFGLNQDALLTLLLFFIYSALSIVSVIIYVIKLFKTKNKYNLLYILITVCINVLLFLLIKEI